VAGTINSDLTTDNPRIQIRKGLKNEIFFDYDINGYMYDIALIKVLKNSMKMKKKLKFI